MNNTNVRKNINVSRVVADWYEERSKLTGLSQSAIMGIALNDYMELQTTGTTLKSLNYFVNKMEQLKTDIDK